MLKNEYGLICFKPDWIMYPREGSEKYAPPLPKDAIY